MSVTIEIYPTEIKTNVLSCVQETMKNYSDYLRYSDNLRFYRLFNKIEEEVYDFIFDKENGMSLNRVDSPYARSLFIDASKIDEVFTAADIVEGLRLKDGNLISTDFINQFELVGECYSLVSMGSRAEYEIDLMCLLASALASVTEGFVYFTEGSERCGYGIPSLMTSEEFFSFVSENIKKGCMQ